MPEKDALEHLEGELARQIARFDSSRRFYRSANFSLTLTTAILSASTTVLIGVSQILHLEWVSIVSLVFSAGITVVAAYDGFLRSKELWIQKTGTWTALQNLNAHIQYMKVRSSDHLSQRQIDEFCAHFDQILMHEHEAWMTVRTTSEHGTQLPGSPRLAADNATRHQPTPTVRRCPQ